MKLIIAFLLAISSISATTYFGEFFECGTFDKCATEYKNCQSDTVCKYNLYSSPCIDPCGVDYQKFFEEMRTYEKTFNNDQLLAIFPEASCDFQTCQEAWLKKINNGNLTALKQCEMEKCMMTYPSYTFIAHAYKEAKQCKSLLYTCVDTDPLCQKEMIKANKCVEEKGLGVSPQANPDKYFKEPISGFMPAIEACYPDPTEVKIEAYTNLMNCLAQVWNN